jgi:hypothetical protein
MSFDGLTSGPNVVIQFVVPVVSETYDELLAIVTADAHVCAYAGDVAAAQSDSAIKAESFFMVNSLRYRKKASGS